MKKILLLLILIASFSFAGTCTKISIVKTIMSYSACQSNLQTYSGTQCINDQVQGYTYFVHPFGENVSCPVDGVPVLTPPEPVGNSLCSPNANGDITCVANPDPIGGGRCRELFNKDGVINVCNPNTNESRPEPDLQLIPNADGVVEPSCMNGKTYVSQNMIGSNSDGSPFINYTDRGCTTPTGVDNNSGQIVPDSGTTPTVTTNANGSKTWVSPDGNTYNLETNGTLTTTYADGSTSVKQVGSNYGAGSSSGGSGSSGGGTSGNTTNEDNAITPPTDTPIDNTPVANSCNDSALTLQEKMLCELNAGMKKQNSETAPENSLNQLLKDLKTSNQTDNTAMNTNLKDIKSLNENQLNKQTQANATLEKINDSANATELYNKVMTEDLNKLVNNTQDAEGKSYLGTITDFVKTLTTPVSGDDKSSYSNQINSNVNSSLGSTLSKYSNVLGFGSAYANRPENITMTIFNQQYTLIDFSILDSYISMIRSLFLTLAYLYGFMNLIRSSN
ncbi:MAG: hypothetical protein PHG81_11935 [Aliarcobacter sp.]|nr:hypothetical protein [Aliarcobacter sp.]